MWFQLKIERCPVEQLDELSDELEEFGALSIMLTDKNDNPVLEPEPGTTPLWPEVVLHALFPEAMQAQFTRDKLTETHPHLNLTLEILEDQDWERAWMADFKPQRFGKNLWICPTWSTPPDPDAVNLMLDPGLAFGTGTHPTTALCLTWLEQAKMQQKSVIDYGCGSGILSLAALKLGACHVSAVDIDHQALQATQNNAQTNHLDLKLLQVSLPEELETPANLLIANILLAPLISLKTRFHHLVHPKGMLVVSGLLTEQASLLIETYKPEFLLLGQENLLGWSLLIFSRV